jgi:hypothetical protein
MGYTTDFWGSLTPSRELTEEEEQTINDLQEVRHEDGYEKGRSIWCNWIIEDGELTWNGAEKFYAYVPWLRYLISEYFDKWGVKLNGEIEYQGEDFDDRGVIFVEDNVVKVYGYVIDKTKEIQ